MLRQLLNTASSFDLISPATAFIQDLCNGPPAYFGIPPDAGWSPGAIRSLLTRHGVKVWGLMLSVDGDILMFTVPKPQAKWTFYLLQREGVPILYAPDEAVSSSTRQSRKRAGAATPLDPVFDFLDRLDEDRS